MHHPSTTDSEETSRGVVPGRHVRVSGEAARVGAPNLCTPAGQPQLEMIRDGDILRAIDVICSCGKRIRMRCVYSNTAG
jgi:hypothetical protein